MTDTAQVMCLLLMFVIGAFSVALMQLGWDHASRLNRALRVAWALFWLVPPLWFIWTKGVMG